MDCHLIKEQPGAFLDHSFCTVGSIGPPICYREQVMEQPGAFWVGYFCTVGSIGPPIHYRASHSLSEEILQVEEAFFGIEDSKAVNIRGFTAPIRQAETWMNMLTASISLQGTGKGASLSWLGSGVGSGLGSGLGVVVC